MLVASKKTKILYTHVSSDYVEDRHVFERLSDGKQFIMNRQQASEMIVIPAELNAVVLENPLVIDLIKIVGGNVVVSGDKIRKEYKVK